MDCEMWRRATALLALALAEALPRGVAVGSRKVHSSFCAAQDPTDNCWPLPLPLCRCKVALKRTTLCRESVAFCDRARAVCRALRPENSKPRACGVVELAGAPRKNRHRTEANRVRCAANLLHWGSG